VRCHDAMVHIRLCDEDIKVWSEEGLRVPAALQKHTRFGKLNMNTVTVDSTFIDSKRGLSPPDTMATRDAKA